jgi:hypothetical protein
MATESRPIRKAIIDSKFITIMNAKENIIYSAAMVVVDEQGNQIYANEWDLTYNLKGYAPHTYKYGLALANTPKYRPARGEVKTKYRRSAKQLGCLQLLIKRLQKNLNIKYFYSKGPTQTDLLLLDKCRFPKICYNLEKNPQYVKYEGIHHPLSEIQYYKQFLFDPESEEYKSLDSNFFLKRMKTHQRKKDAYKENNKKIKRRF